MNGVFIAGTDTGIGKTLVAAAVVALSREQGVNAVPVKPVQTGCAQRDGARVAPDLEFCLRMSGLKLDPSETDALCPVKLALPASPHLAAAHESTTVSVIELVSAVRAIDQAHGFVVVEGAGGLMVPLNPREMMLDLAVSLDLPVVLVARSGLGTINHTLLSLCALRAAGSEPVAVVLNDVTPNVQEEIAVDNRRTIERCGAVTVAGRIPFTPGIEDFNSDQFLEFAGAHLAELMSCLGV